MEVPIVNCVAVYSRLRVGKSSLSVYGFVALLPHPQTSMSVSSRGISEHAHLPILVPASNSDGGRELSVTAMGYLFTYIRRALRMGKHSQVPHPGPLMSQNSSTATSADNPQGAWRGEPCNRHERGDRYQRKRRMHTGACSTAEMHGKSLLVMVEYVGCHIRFTTSVHLRCHFGSRRPCPWHLGTGCAYCIRARRTFSVTHSGTGTVSGGHVGGAARRDRVHATSTVLPCSTDLHMLPNPGPPKPHLIQIRPARSAEYVTGPPTRGQKTGARAA